VLSISLCGCSSIPSAAALRSLQLCYPPSADCSSVPSTIALLIPSTVSSIPSAAILVDPLLAALSIPSLHLCSPLYNCSSIPCTAVFDPLYVALQSSIGYSESLYNFDPSAVILIPPLSVPSA
ncbi:hypothetical protein AVEN_206602-1, partial [Araneus ventricosus]